MSSNLAAFYYYALLGLLID